MKPSNIAFCAAGYVLGARAGRARYEQIVRVARRVRGSQTVQSTAGVLRAQVGQVTTSAGEAVKQRARQVVSGGPSATIAQLPPQRPAPVNGHHRA